MMEVIARILRSVGQEEDPRKSHGVRCDHLQHDLVYRFWKYFKQKHHSHFLQWFFVNASSITLYDVLSALPPISLSYRLTHPWESSRKIFRILVSVLWSSRTRATNSGSPSRYLSKLANASWPWSFNVPSPFGRSRSNSTLSFKRSFKFAISSFAVSNWLWICLFKSFSAAKVASNFLISWVKVIYCLGC